jgi:DNA-binding HxlR family transcriptional regulator/putative sterol carrier protein
VSRRTYDQYCGLARALDILGERWTILIVRELLIGPKRFSDLMDGLPGIGANALSARMRSLEQDGLVTKRRLPPPAASTVYELTERGRALDPVVMELMRWGIDLLGPPGEGDRFRPGWIVTSIRARFDSRLAAGVTRAYRLQVGDEVFTVRIDDGELEVFQGEAPGVDVSMSADSDTVLALVSGELSAEDAIDQGRIAVDRGDVVDALAFLGMVRLPAAVAA